MLSAAIRQELAVLGDAARAANLQRFFKTGPGQYGAGDCFRGIRVSVLRQLARKYQDVSVDEAGRLLHSAFHEDRLLALLLLIRHYYWGDQAVKEKIHPLRMAHTRPINNWDLVAASGNFWERRMAIIATLYFIVKQNHFDETIRIARLLLRDPEDLIHKAVGWMLREVEKRQPVVAEAFLQEHYRSMPRTMLR